MFQCPICKSPVPESMLDQPKSTFPFCSDRCRLIDLGRWIDGKYQIPVEDDNESYRGDSSEGFGSGEDEEPSRG